MVLQFPPPEEKLLPHRIAITWPTAPPSSNSAFDDRIDGSLIGLAVGDALGASVEFRPRQYLLAHPVEGMASGGTWGLQAGQWTDDTSMALCLAASLISQRAFNPYDQLVRYKWWYKDGYLSSTGQCFDIGKATRNAIEKFCRRQEELREYLGVWEEAEMDRLPLVDALQNNFNIYCSEEGVAGNGALMRLAPVPIYFHRTPADAVRCSGESARLTHGDRAAIDACRYYAALIVAAIQGESKEALLSPHFYKVHQSWFEHPSLHPDILRIAHGSFRKRHGYKDGIRGKGHVVCALEAALWAFWSSETFKAGALNAVNLGDDTDTTAAIYGQLAGAHYGYNEIPVEWTKQLYAHELIRSTAAWLQELGPTESKPDPYGRRVHARPSSAGRLQQTPVRLQDQASKKTRTGQEKRSKEHGEKKRSKSAGGHKSRSGGFFSCATRPRTVDD